MKQLLILYCLIITAIFLVAGLLVSEQPNQYLYSLMFAPLVIFFARQLAIPYVQASDQPTARIRIPRSKLQSPKKAKPSPKSSQSQIISADEGIVEPEILSDEAIVDINKRLFLKLIGSAGLGLFVFSLFSKQSHAAFFGSMPGPGIIKLKDSSDNIIDPAQKEPTDGYEIQDVDDATTPAYYGFVDKDGRWYITKEDASGSFRYVRGATSYATNWITRDQHAYDYFNNVF